MGYQMDEKEMREAIAHYREQIIDPQEQRIRTLEVRVATLYMLLQRKCGVSNEELADAELDIWITLS